MKWLNAYVDWCEKDDRFINISYVVLMIVAFLLFLLAMEGLW